MSPSIPQKQCTKCKQFKPANTEFFHKEAKRRDGFRCWCKDCTHADNNARSKTPAGRGYMKKYNHSENGKRHRARIMRNYVENNRDQRSAHFAVQNAVRAGKLEPVISRLCVKCSKSAECYHHWSYAPEHRLDVIPMCLVCHGKEHNS
jgi:hypothetical protein